MDAIDRARIFKSAVQPAHIASLRPGDLLRNLAGNETVRQLERRLMHLVAEYDWCAPERLPPDACARGLVERALAVVEGAPGPAHDELVELAAFTLLGVRLGLTRSR
jgi:hypothetical protein